MDTYADLLHTDEINWYNSILSLTKSAQCLYIRLLMRRGLTFRMSRLEYTEIDNLTACAKALAAGQLGCCQAPDTLPPLTACFTKPELLDILELSTSRHLSRVALLDEINSRDAATRADFVCRLQQADEWISIHGHRFWMLMQLCFFGNLYQDSSEFIMRELGSLRYESYPLEAKARAFTSRGQIEAHWRYFECAELFDCVPKRSAEQLIQLAHCLPSCPSEDLILLRRVERLRNRIAYQLERLSCIDEAISLYVQSSQPPSRERQVRILMLREQWQDALELTEHMAHSAYHESEALVAQRLNIKCRKALGMLHDKHRVFKPASSKLVLHAADGRVEELARAFYARNGACFHTENTLVNAILGLFIWDIIYHPVPGVFFNPFQIAPADFMHPSFTTTRDALLATRLDELVDEGDWVAQVQTAYVEHHGKLNPLVRWSRLSEPLLKLALARIPASHWRVLFVRMLSDLRENTSGFPDLVVFPGHGGYEFIEIKGPGDTLQANQRRWMRYFDEHGIECRLVHVRFSTKGL